MHRHALTKHSYTYKKKNKMFFKYDTKIHKVSRSIQAPPGIQIRCRTDFCSLQVTIPPAYHLERRIKPVKSHLLKARTLPCQ